MSDNLLGAFLRARREAVSPREVGLPEGDRRRTPGLRRAELAVLAGVSIDYLTRLEQGRDRHPSMQVLGAIADALRLSVPERTHLLHLSKTASGGLCPAVRPPTQEIRPTVRALLDRMEPTPALVVNRLADVLATTAGYRRLTGPIGLLDAAWPPDAAGLVGAAGSAGAAGSTGAAGSAEPAGPPPVNLVRFLFTDARARSAYPQWDRVADAWVAHLRLWLRRGDPHLTMLVDELTVTGGAPFSDRLADPTLVRQHTGGEWLVHPEVGALSLAYESLALPGADDQRLIVYLPADDATSVALDRLTSPALATA